MPSFIQQLDEHGNPIVYTDVPALGKRRRAGTDEGMEQEMQMKITRYASKHIDASCRKRPELADLGLRPTNLEPMWRVSY